MIRTPTQFCPCCNSKLDAASSVDGDRPPSSGDITVCAYCGTILTFGDKLELTVFTDMEALDEITQDHLTAITNAIKIRNGVTLQ